ncbi:MAG: low molecular weight protein-tyrosine-phosphatase, partial [Acidimicrobiales bacterium]
ICRSPMAEVVLRELAARRALDGGTLADRLHITSAGTGHWHVGEQMDPRARAALEARGYRDHDHVARQLDRGDAGGLDLVVALDRSHLVPGGVLLRSFGLHVGGLHVGGLHVGGLDVDADDVGGHDVPDPYYGDEAGFAECLAVIERGCQGLVDWLAQRLA